MTKKRESGMIHSMMDNNLLLEGLDSKPVVGSANPVNLSDQVTKAMEREIKNLVGLVSCSDEESEEEAGMYNKTFMNDFKFLLRACLSTIPEETEYAESTVGSIHPDCILSDVSPSDSAPASVRVSEDSDSIKMSITQTCLEAMDDKDTLAEESKNKSWSVWRIWHQMRLNLMHPFSKKDLNKDSCSPSVTSSTTMEQFTSEDDTAMLQEKENNKKDSFWRAWFHVGGKNWSNPPSQESLKKESSPAMSSTTLEPCLSEDETERLQKKENKTKHSLLRRWFCRQEKKINPLSLEDSCFPPALSSTTLETFLFEDETERSQEREKNKNVSVWRRWFSVRQKNRFNSPSQEDLKKYSCSPPAMSSTTLEPFLYEEAEKLQEKEKNKDSPWRWWFRFKGKNKIGSLSQEDL